MLHGRVHLAPPPKRGPGRPQGSTRDVTRANILRAARECFARRGFALTTNREIAASAGVTAAAIYQYFPSKTALYASTLADALDEVERQMTALAKVSGKGAAFDLGRMLEGMLSSYDPTLAAFMSAMPADLQRHPELGALAHSRPNYVPSIIMEIVQSGAKRGDLDAADARGLVAMFIACQMGLSQFTVMFGLEEGKPAVQAFVRLLAGELLTQQPTKKRPRRPKPPQPAPRGAKRSPSRK